jgi:hypothetical protein
MYLEQLVSYEPAACLLTVSSDDDSGKRVSVQVDATVYFASVRAAKTYSEVIYCCSSTRMAAEGQRLGAKSAVPIVTAGMLYVILLLRADVIRFATA